MFSVSGVCLAKPCFPWGSKSYLSISPLLRCPGEVELTYINSYHAWTAYMHCVYTYTWDKSSYSNFYSICTLLKTMTPTHQDNGQCCNLTDGRWKNTSHRKWTLTSLCSQGLLQLLLVHGEVPVEWVRKKRHGEWGEERGSVENSIHNQGRIRDWQSSVLCEAFPGRVLFHAVEPHSLIGESLSHRIVLDSRAEHEFHSLREVIHCCRYLTAETQTVNHTLFICPGWEWMWHSSILCLVDGQSYFELTTTKPSRETQPIHFCSLLPEYAPN